MVALGSYWQNEFHHLDRKWFPKDAYLTLYHSFARLGLQALHKQSKSSGFRHIKLLEANVFYESDHFHGLLVLHLAEHMSSGKVIMMETHMHPRHHYTVSKTKGAISRIQTLQVGTVWLLLIFVSVVQTHAFETSQSHSSQCSTTVVTKAGVFVILSVG